MDNRSIMYVTYIYTHINNSAELIYKEKEESTKARQSNLKAYHQNQKFHHIQLEAILQPSLNISLGIA